MSFPPRGGTVDDFLGERPDDPLGGDEDDELEQEADDEDHPGHLDDQDEELLPEPQRGGSSLRGRQGLRTGSQAGSSDGAASTGRRSAAERPAAGAVGKGDKQKDEDGKAKAQRRPRGNLPPAPVFDGDRRKDVKCFRKYASKVDSYVEIAKNIIDDAEIGLRLHAALEGEAADYLEDIPARTFGVESGWQILLKLLQDKYDEKRMHKVGSAMQGFFKLNLTDRQYTMMETADAMDRAARRCREANLVIPDEIMIYFFFEHAQLSTERQANLLLRTSGEYDWKKMKQAVELLYQNVTVKSGQGGRNDLGHRGRPRGTHETHREEWDFWGKMPEWNATEEQLNNFLLDHDPVENLAECELAQEIPEEVARELHTCFQTHRENRQRLAKAVQARGFYVGGGSKGKGKGTKGPAKGKGKSKGKKGSGKARGMSLDELKAKTTCAACGQVGHWKGDPQCKVKSSNEASRHQNDEYDEGAEDWYGPDGDYTAEQWAAWEAERYGYEDRTAFSATRTAPTRSSTAETTTTPTPTAPSDETDKEARAVARGINRVRGKASGLNAAAKDAEQAAKTDTDRFVIRAQDIKEKIQAANIPVMSPSPAPEAVRKAFDHFGLTMATPSGTTVRDLLDSQTKPVDVESLRQALMVTRPPRKCRRISLDFAVNAPRAVLSNMRRPPTVTEGRFYLTLDTACENTVAGTTILQSITTALERQFSLQPKIEPEHESYCFGPGDPVVSKERWFMPIGIRGAHSVICSSSIPDARGSKIPFLAGQDWMVFVDACIDVGRSEVVLREMNVTAPLYIDVTGHLVLAIDEIEGWPQGVVARKNGYPGVLFEGDGRSTFSASKAEARPDRPFDQGEFSSHFAPTHVYEPMSAVEQAQPCIVPADMWEFMIESQVYVRHHRRPRRELFSPEEFLDGPDPRDLQDVRVTLLSNEAEPVIDSWRGVTNIPRDPWVGVTYFFGKGAKQLGKVDMLRPPSKVHVTLSDGTVVHAEPAEVRAASHKKVHHFDLSTAQTLDLHHAQHLDLPRSRRKGCFEIPAGEFGSEQFKDRTSSRAQSHARILEQPAEVEMPRLGPTGRGAQGLDPLATGPGGAHRDDAACQAPGPLDHGGAGGDSSRRTRARADASDDATSDDNSTGSDQEGRKLLPQQDRPVQASPRLGEAHGQQPRPVHGVRGVRQDVEGGDLQGALLGRQRDDPGVRAGSRLSCGAGRQDRQEGHRARHRGPLSKLAGMLLVAAGTLLGNHNEEHPGSGLPPSILEQAQGFGDFGLDQWQDGGADGGGGIGAGLRGHGEGRPPEAQARAPRASRTRGGTTSGGPPPEGSSRGPEIRGAGSRPVHASGRAPQDSDRLRGTSGPEGEHREERREGHQGPRSGHGVHFERQLHGGPGDGAAGLGGRDHGVCDHLRRGQVRRMVNHAKTALKTSQLERQMIGHRLDSSRWPRRKFGYDLVEIFGGHSMVSIRAVGHWGMKVLQPIDLRFGLDLRRSPDQQRLLDTLARFNPRLAVVEMPCTPWSALRSPATDREAGTEAQEDRRIYLHFVFRIFEEQKRRGGHALAEIPGDLEAQAGPELNDLRARHYETATDLCVFDFVGKGNRPAMRKVRFVGTHPLLVQGLASRCSPWPEDPPVPGQPPGEQPAYPPALGDAICRAYLDVVSAEDFGSTATWTPTESRAAYYVDANRREDDWRPLLEQAQELLGRKTAHSLQVHPGTDLYRRVENLVPWQIASVQVAYLPKAKRVKAGLEECHRASVLLMNDDSITIETEFLRDAQAPRERFVAPVRVAIFVLGYVPGEPDAPAPARPGAAQPAPEDEPVRDEVQEGLEREGLVRQDVAGECWFSGGPLKPAEKQLAKALVRMHRNLGHPRQEDFTRALAQNQKVAPEAVALSRRLRCATCERTRRPLPPRPTSLKATGPFNSRVCLDFVHIHDSEKSGHLFLHILEPNGSYNVFCPVESRVPAHVFEMFTTVWATWAGYPDVLVVDQDGAFESDFADKINALGSVLEPIAAQSHWQAGQVEAYNRAFRYAAAKAIDEHSLAGPADMKMLGAMIGAALSDKVRTCGCSPNEWLFGRSPKTPWDLLSPDGKIQAMQGLEQDAELRRRQQVRATADAKVAEFAVNNALRQAVLRLDRPGRSAYEPGELVAFWREAKMKKDPKSRKPRRVPAGWYRGTIIGPHKGDHAQSNYWVTSGGRCLLVSKEQLRPAYGTELWRVQESELQDILDAPPETFEDIRGQGPSEAMAQEPGEVIPFFDGLDDLDFSDQGTLPPTPAGPLPPTPRGPPLHDPGVPEGAERGERERSPRRSEPGPTASAAPSVGTDQTQPSPTMRSYAAPHPEEPEPKRLRMEEEGEDEAHSAHVHLCNLYVPASLEELSAKPSQQFQEDVLSHAAPRNSSTTRKERKALEKEIPYSMIPEHELADYREALVKEWGVWTKYEAVSPLDLDASAAVEANFNKARILDTRVCYRNKNAAFPWLPLKAKARLVCRGDRDPDLLTLRRDAPTMTRMALMVILQVAASMSEWFLFNSDITGAFLQGDQGLASRKEPLFLRQPREGLPGLVAGQLLLVVRGIFGLANSPRLFWRHLRDTLKKIGFIQSVLDKALFMYYQNGKLILVLGAHVDDLLGTGEPGTADAVLERVKKAFDFGSWADSRSDEVLEYGGKQVSKGQDGVVTLCQEKFIQAISVYQVPRWRSITPLEPLSPTEVTELKSGGGCLHWLIGQTRPDLAAATSLNMSGQPTVTNLVEINKLLREAQKTQDWKLKFVPIPLDTAKIIAFSDASWANAEGLKSQAGFLTFVAGPEVTTVQGDQASLMDWRSHRIQRQCRSTLAAETMAMDTAFDSGIFLRELLAEVLVQSYMPVQSGTLPATFLQVHPVTDCRSLFDLLTKDGPVSSTQEKRLTIDISAIKESAEEFDPEGEALREIFRWADTDHQLADHLTKAKPPHQLRDLLSANWLSLQADDPT